MSNLESIGNSESPRSPKLFGNEREWSQKSKKSKHMKWKKIYIGIGVSCFN